MIKSFVCLNGGTKEIKYSEIKEHLKTKKPIWIDVEAPTKDELDFLEREFKFHHLAIEDSISDQRAKIDEYGKYCFIIIHALDQTVLAPVQLNFFLSKNYLVTIHQKSVNVIKVIEERCKRNSLILSKGTDFLVYSIFDFVVDEFFPLMDQLEDQIDDVEDKIFESPNPKVLSDLVQLKRKMFSVRKIIWPLRDVLNMLSRGDFKYVRPSHTIYFRDVYDHVTRMIDIIDVCRELVTTGMEGYLTTISNYLNFIMKKLTSFTVILMVPSLIAGIYGMNFENMPELRTPYGYLFALVTMIISVIVLYSYFHKKDWI